MDLKLSKNEKPRMKSQILYSFIMLIELTLIPLLQREGLVGIRLYMIRADRKKI